MSEAYRSSDPRVLPDDYNKMYRENESLKSRQRQRARDVFWGTAAVTAILVVVALVVFPLYWGLIRGNAWGLRARQNAEREALRYASAVYPAAHLRVTCEDYPGGDLHCVVLGGESKMDLICDDDEPFRNDGCRTMTMPVQDDNTTAARKPNGS